LIGRNRAWLSSRGGAGNQGARWSSSGGHGRNYKRRLGRTFSFSSWWCGWGRRRRERDVYLAVAARQWAGIPDSATVENLSRFGVTELCDPSISVLACEESATGFRTIITFEDEGGIIFTTASTHLGTGVAYFILSTEVLTTVLVHSDVLTGSRFFFVEVNKSITVDTSREGLSWEECKHYGEHFS